MCTLEQRQSLTLSVKTQGCDRGGVQDPERWMKQFPGCRNLVNPRPPHQEITQKGPQKRYKAGGKKKTLTGLQGPVCFKANW